MRSSSFFLPLHSIPFAQQEVGKWKRYELSLENPSWDGNPFKLDIKGIFKSPKGRSLEQWSFYTGDNTWILFFIPDEIGTWTFITQSTDPEINNQTGTIQYTLARC